MAIVKLRTAVQKEQTCSCCGCVIKKGERYADTNEKKDPPKPFPTKKYCITCSEKPEIKSVK